MSRAIDDAWIRQIGRPVFWERATLTTQTLGLGGTDFTRTELEDRGFLFAAPQKIVVKMTSDDRRKNITEAGEWEQGTALLTYSARLQIAEHDRIVPFDFTTRRTTPLVANGQATQALGRVYGRDVIEVQGATATYVKGVDVLLSSDAAGQTTLQWTREVPPVAGTRLQVTWLGMPIWIVQGTPMIRDFGAGTRNQLLKRARVQRLDTVLFR